jgi:hypothetical protein
MNRLTPMAHTEAKTITVGITGASGAIYAQVLLRALDRDARFSAAQSATAPRSAWCALACPAFPQIFLD